MRFGFYYVVYDIIRGFKPQKVECVGPFFFRHKRPVPCEGQIIRKEWHWRKC